MVDLSIKLGQMQLKNPVMTASGTFGYGVEYSDFMDVSRIGGIIVKGTTLRDRQGNPYPRMAETPSGMLNAVGLQNKGVDYFIKHIYPTVKDINTDIFVNVSGSTVEDYIETAERLNDLEKIPGIELNISCPNVKEGGMAFGTSCPSAAQVVKSVRRVYKKELMVKLSPNVTDISEIALAVEAQGADSVSSFAFSSTSGGFCNSSTAFLANFSCSSCAFSSSFFDSHFILRLLIITLAPVITDIAENTISINIIIFMIFYLSCIAISSNLETSEGALSTSHFYFKFSYC